MCPIPGNIIFVCVVEITRYRADRLRKLYVGHSIGWSPEERPGVREEIPSIANDAMMHRAIDRWMDIRMDIRMYRSGNSSPHRPGLAEWLEATASATLIDIMKATRTLHIMARPPIRRVTKRHR
jgi:hypothetical protein